LPTLTLQQLTDIAQCALAHAGASAEVAAVTAHALVAAEAQGLSSHGMARVPQYALHLRNGRADGKAVRAVIRSKCATLLVDAKSGLAFPACALAVAESLRRAREYGVAFAGVINSHHFGVAAYHLLPVAESGMVGPAFGNSPAAMAAVVRHQSHRGDISAARCRAVDDRHFPRGGRAGKGDGCGEEGGADSTWLGARSRWCAHDGRASHT
jgi:(2R)-3-sulfolactate dehydrogenase (NADP+)